MNSPIRFNLSALLLVFSSLAQANDACHGTAISATADVTGIGRQAVRRADALPITL